MSKQPNESNENEETTRRPNDRSGGLFIRLVAVLAAVLMCGGAAVTILAAPASAHNGTLTPTYKCVEGKTAITWSGTTSNVPAGVTATVNIIDVEPAGSTIGAVTPNPVQPNGSFSFTQTVPGDATFAQAVAHIQWSNGVVDDPIGQVNLPGNCVPTDTEVTPAAPSATTPDCTNPNITVTPGNQPGVVWNPAGPSTLTPGQSVTYTAAPADGYTFPTGQQTSWPFTNNFNIEDCSTKVIPAQPTVTTASCEQPNIQVGATDQVGVIWDKRLPITLEPGQSVTLNVSPADGYNFPSDAQTSWSFTNDFKVEDCEPPQGVGDYNGNLSTTCHTATGNGYVDEDYVSGGNARVRAGVKFVLSTPTDKDVFWVKPGGSGTGTVNGQPGATATLTANGEQVAVALLKNCDTPPEPPEECVGYDTDGDGVIDQDECVPTTTADTGLEDVVSNRSAVGAGQAMMLIGAALLFGVFLLRRPTFAGLRRRW